MDVLEAMAVCLLLWQETWRQRKRLAALDDAALKDIGLSQADVAAELRKPVWRRQRDCRKPSAKEYFRCSVILRTM